MTKLSIRLFWTLCAVTLATAPGCAKTHPAKSSSPSSPPDAEATETAPEPAPDPEAVKWVWTATSRDGQVKLEQTATIARLCKVRCTRGGSELWAASICLGNRDVAHLLSDDGDRVLVVDPAPVVQGSWRAATLVSSYVRSDLKAQLLASDLFSDEKALVVFPDSLQWLAGARKQPEPPPRYLEGAPDQVELTLVDGRKAVVSLDGKVLSGGRPAPKLEPKAPTRAVKKKPRPKR